MTTRPGLSTIRSRVPEVLPTWQRVIKPIDLCDADAFLQAHRRYVITHATSEVASVGAGAQAAEGALKYLSTLAHRGSSAPRSARQMKLGDILLSRVSDSDAAAGPQEHLNPAEQVAIATLLPRTAEEAVALVPSLARFASDDLKMLTELVNN